MDVLIVFDIKMPGMRQLFIPYNTHKRLFTCVKISDILLPLLRNTPNTKSLLFTFAKMAVPQLDPNVVIEFLEDTRIIAVTSYSNITPPDYYSAFISTLLDDWISHETPPWFGLLEFKTYVFASSKVTVIADEFMDLNIEIRDNHGNTITEYNGLILRETMFAYMQNRGDLTILKNDCPSINLETDVDSLFGCAYYCVIIIRKYS